MKKWKKLWSIGMVVLLLLFSVTGNRSWSYAEDAKKNYVVMCIEKFTLGQGYVLEPTVFPIQEGDTAAHVLLKYLKESKISYESTGSLDGKDFYLASLQGVDDKSLNIPKIITQNGGPSNKNNDGNADDFLGEFDYSSMSGWMITVNNCMIPVGSSDFEVKNGDVLRWAFTLWGYGADLGYSTGWGNEAYFQGANKGALLTLLAKMKQDNRTYLDSYNLAVQAAKKLTATQTEVDTIYQKLLTEYETELKTPAPVTPIVTEIPIITEIPVVTETPQASKLPTQGAVTSIPTTPEPIKTREPEPVVLPEETPMLSQTVIPKPIDTPKPRDTIEPATTPEATVLNSPSVASEGSVSTPIVNIETEKTAIPMVTMDAVPTQTPVPVQITPAPSSNPNGIEHDIDWNKVKVTSTKKNLYLGETNNICVKFPKELEKKTVMVSYESRKKEVAAISQKGKITAKKKGSTYIIVTLAIENEKKVFAIKITVKNPSLKITNQLSRMKVGEKKTFQAKAVGIRKKIKWSVNNKRLAYINKKTGRLTAKKQGTVIIQAACGNMIVTRRIKIYKK